MNLLSNIALTQALAIQDLTDVPTHAISKMVCLLLEGLPKLGWPALTIYRGEKIVSRAENYGLLGYSDDDVTLSSVHTRWVDDHYLLRTQTTSLISKALPVVVQRRKVGEVLGLIAPGMTYRRDQRDRWHCAEPHQMDVWMVMDRVALEEGLDHPKDKPHPILLKLVRDILTIALPEKVWKTQPSPHHYTEGGVEVQVLHEGQWIEVMECGLIAKTLLERLNLDSTLHAGLALGMGLDRLVMIRKGIPDIRLLRDTEPRIQSQMHDLNPWKMVSRQPSTSRDLSLARHAGGTEEALVEEALKAMGEKRAWCEAIEVKQIWKEGELPEIAKVRLGLLPTQENWLIRLTLRDWTNSIPTSEANALYEKVYKALHQGRSAGYAYSSL